MLEFIKTFLGHYFSEFFNYLMAGTIFFTLFYYFFRKKWSYKKIQLNWPSNKDYYREFGYSALTLVVFAFVGMTIIESPISKYTQLYWDFGEQPLWYYAFTFPIMLVMHDTYFYWMHRGLHHPKIFKYAHLTHHKSTNPSPWAAYAFHPIEAIFEAMIFPIIVFVMPVHISAVAWFFLFQIFYNVYGHLGFEIYPKGFNRHWFGRWINTSTHHNLHHHHFDNSYGLYFTFWDRVMGTMAPQYDETFEDVATREKVASVR